MEKQYLTKAGLEKLKTELEWRKKEKKLEIAQKIEEAKSLGDLSENAAYSTAREEQAFNEGRIKEIEVIVKHAILIDHQEGKGIKRTVEVGCTVVMKVGKGKETISIVGSIEANPREGKLSNESPIGKALLGHKIGDNVEITLPGGKTTRYQIESIQ